MFCVNSKFDAIRQKQLRDRVKSFQKYRALEKLQEFTKISTECDMSTYLQNLCSTTQFPLHFSMIDSKLVHFRMKINMIKILFVCLWKEKVWHCKKAY